jgi:hypothetical protein
MKITIETIPHNQQRYKTCGDWQWVNGDLVVYVSEMGNWGYEAAVGIHEAVEAILCRAAGVPGTLVDAFDKAYDGIDEPGDEADAPYRNQHCFATAVERMLIAALGVKWSSYEQAIEAL